MTFQVRLYIHHDNDLIQLHLNGIRLCDVFAKSLEAHYKKEKIQFSLPESLEFKPNKGKVYRIKVTLDDKKQQDLIRWVCAFPDQYKCHCIKNIARSYLGSTVIDSLNEMSLDGAWEPDKRSPGDGTQIVPLKKWKKKTDNGDDGFQWIEQVSASRKKTESQIRMAEEGRKRIHDLPVEEILGTRPMDTAEAIGDTRTAKTAKAATAKTTKAPRHPNAQAAEKPIVQAAPDEPIPAADQKTAVLEELAAPVAGRIAGGYPETDDFDVSSSFYQAADMPAADTMEEEDDFDASLLFEQLRAQ